MVEKARRTKRVVVEMGLVKGGYNERSETGAFSELKTSLALPRQGMPNYGGEVRWGRKVRNKPARRLKRGCITVPPCTESAPNYRRKTNSDGASQSRSFTLSCISRLHSRTSSTQHSRRHMASISSSYSLSYRIDDHLAQDAYLRTPVTLALFFIDIPPSPQ